jgi:hypothetical protein
MQLEFVSELISGWLLKVFFSDSIAGKCISRLLTVGFSTNLNRFDLQGRLLLNVEHLAPQIHPLDAI